MMNGVMLIVRSMRVGRDVQARLTLFIYRKKYKKE